MDEENMRSGVKTQRRTEGIGGGGVDVDVDVDVDVGC
jgi:hypothetical protein